MSRPGDYDPYAAIRAIEKSSLMSLEVNDQQVIGMVLRDELFPNGIRRSTDPYPEVILEVGGKRFRFRCSGNVKMDMDSHVMKLEMDFHGGLPCDED